MSFASSLARLLVLTVSPVMALRVSSPVSFSLAARRAGVVRACSSSSALVSQIQSTISSNKVVVYSKSYCPFCGKTKALFDGLETEYTAIELDLMEDGAEVQDALLELTQQRTVPNVFVAGEHVGGNDDVQKAFKSGKLDELLAK